MSEKKKCAHCHVEEGSTRRGRIVVLRAITGILLCFQCWRAHSAKIEETN